jgi:lysozyme
MTDPKKLAFVTALATAIAVPAEGLRQYAYRDPVGIPTICFGSTHGVKLGDVATVDQCRAMLNRDMLNAIQAVDTCRPGLPPAVLAAFADAVYNIGPTVACDSARSTAARKLADKDYIAACNELPKWDKARVAGVMTTLPGLTKRRAAERDLCLSGIA